MNMKLAVSLILTLTLSIEEGWAAGGVEDQGAPPAQQAQEQANGLSVWVPLAVVVLVTGAVFIWGLIKCCKKLDQSVNPPTPPEPTIPVWGYVKTDTGASVPVGTQASGYPGLYRCYVNRSNGFYRFLVPPGWTGTVSAGSYHYMFDPAGVAVENIREQLQVNFVGHMVDKMALPVPADLFEQPGCEGGRQIFMPTNEPLESIWRDISARNWTDTQGNVYQAAAVRQILSSADLVTWQTNLTIECWVSEAHVLIRADDGSGYPYVNYISTEGAFTNMIPLPIRFDQTQGYYKIKTLTQ